MKNKLGTIAWLLALAQVMLILVSWLIAAAFPEKNVHSLLSSEGIRWFFGRFTDNLQTPLLIWIILIAIAAGTFTSSGLAAIRPGRTMHYRQRMALRMVIIELIIFTAALILLTAIPHAVLLSVTGSLWPSSFSESIVPIAAFITATCSITYGLISGKLKTNADIYQSLTIGLARSAFLLPIYILTTQLIQSAIFVFHQT